MPITTRPATPADAAAIAKIYNQGIEDRIATFETRPRTPEEITRWFDGVHPIVVAEEAGQVVGFASTSSRRARPPWPSGRPPGPRRAHRGITQGGTAQARLADLSRECREPGRLSRGGLSRGRRLQGARPARGRVEGLRHRRAPGRLDLVLAAELFWRDRLQDFEHPVAGRGILERVAILARARRDLWRCRLVIPRLHRFTRHELSAIEHITRGAFGRRSPGLSRRVDCWRLRGRGAVDRALGV